MQKERAHCGNKSCFSLLIIAFQILRLSINTCPDLSNQAIFEANDHTMVTVSFSVFFFHNFFSFFNRTSVTITVAPGRSLWLQRITFPFRMDDFSEQQTYLAILSSLPGLLPPVGTSAVNVSNTSIAKKLSMP